MFLKTFPHDIFGGHTCDICCSYDPCELIEVPSGSHEYESVSFFGFIFHCFCWLDGCVQCRAAVLNVIVLSSLQGAQRKSLLEKAALFPLKNFKMRKMTEKEDLMKEFELLQEGSKYFFNEIGYKKRSHVIMVLEI